MKILLISIRSITLLVPIILAAASLTRAANGGAMLGTDHRFNRGEFYYGSVSRLIAEQNRQYTAETGRKTDSQQDKALAAWYWRVTHYFHSTAGLLDYNGDGQYGKGDLRCAGFWTGLVGNGYGFCQSNHTQWTPFMDAILGYQRSRVSRVDGHAAFETFLTGGVYGDGKWVIVDADEMCVIFRGHPDFNSDGDGPSNRLMGIKEMDVDVMSEKDWMAVTDCTPLRPKQQGWYCFGQNDFGPHPGSGKKPPKRCYTHFVSIDYSAGYLEAPPIVNLRAGETFRRYYTNGMGGSNYVFWGNNQESGGGGPAHWQSWACQPERCYNSGKPVKNMQVFASNAVFTYSPNFSDGSYREGVVSESDDHVTFEFHSPYVIGCTPPNKKNWGIYDPGGKKGLVLTAAIPPNCTVQISDSCHEKAVWSDPIDFNSTSLDLTDFVKGKTSYFIRFNAGEKQLAGKGVTMRTVCQANGTLTPKIDGVTEVAYENLGKAVFAIHPGKAHIEQYRVAGAFGTKMVEFDVPAPRGAKIREVYAAAKVSNSNPPPDDLRYTIIASVDGGKTYDKTLFDGGKFPLYAPDQGPNDLMSSSWISGHVDISDAGVSSVRVKFTGSDKWRTPQLAFLWLVYDEPNPAPMKVTFNFGENQTISHVFDGGIGVKKWDVSDVAPPAGTKNNWVEMTPVVAARPAVETPHAATPNAAVTPADETSIQANDREPEPPPADLVEPVPEKATAAPVAPPAAEPAVQPEKNSNENTDRPTPSPLLFNTTSDSERDPNAEMRSGIVLLVLAGLLVLGVVSAAFVLKLKRKIPDDRMVSDAGADDARPVPAAGSRRRKAGGSNRKHASGSRRQRASGSRRRKRN